MIIYKNCFPNDFAQLHNREGKVYKCILSKPQFIAYAQQQLEEQQKQLEQKIQNYQEHSHLTKKDLREFCAYHITVAMPHLLMSILNEIELNEQCLIAIISKADYLEDRVIVVGHTIRKNPHSIRLIEKLLQSLSEPYADIAVHDRKHPILKRNNYNIRLLDVLTNIGYLSSYSETDKGLKINKKALIS